MKINHDCIRDLLLYLEENLILTPNLEFCSISLQELINSGQLNYPKEVIAHTATLLDQAGYIDISVSYADNCISSLDIYRITYDGYNFLDSIRPQTVWDKTKSACSKLGSWSFNTITQIASNVLSQTIPIIISNL